MDRTKADGQLILVEWDLVEQRCVLPGADDAGECRPSSIQQTSNDTKGKELIRLYEEGKRDFSGADLHKANLQGVSLLKVRLIMANLCEAEMSEARLDGARLSKANLRGANLEGAKLVGAKLQGADLNEANLHNADLRRADLRETNLRGTNLQGANLLGARLAGAILDDETQISDTWRLIWEIVNQDSNGHDPGETEPSGTGLSAPDLNHTTLAEAN